MGMPVDGITRKGLADLIREKFGVKAAMFMFGALLIANIGTLITEIAAVKTTSAMLNIPPIPFVVAVVLVSFFFVAKVISAYPGHHAGCQPVLHCLYNFRS